MRNFLFRKTKLSQEDKKNPLYYSLASQTRIPYLLISLPPQGRALDLGCGIGFLSNILAQNLGEVMAIDPDKKSINKARELYQAPNIKFIEAAAEKIPLPSDSIDFLLCSEVLEHVDNLERTFEEMKRVCRDNSKFLITVPSADGVFGNFFLKIGHSESGQYEQHKRPPFSKNNISKLLLNNNFQIEKIYYSKIFLAEIFMGITKLLHNLKKGGAIGGQADILLPPKTYQKIFPLVLWLARLEDFILNNALKGHMIILSGKIKKSTSL